MEIIRLSDYPGPPEKLSIALGFFDGVHLGHRKIIDEAVSKAHARGCLAGVFTFRNHPFSVLAPDRTPPLITTFEEKAELIGGMGVDRLVYVDFDETFADTSPEAFVDEIIWKRLGACWISAGPNYRFGRDSAGDVELLERLTERHPFGLSEAVPVFHRGKMVNSTWIREEIQAGNLDNAAQLLGRPYFIEGEVVHGKGLGAKLGYPTVNIVPLPEKVLPPPGVFAALLYSGARTLRAIAYLGTSPTFGRNVLTLEAYILNFSGDLYGERLRLSLLERLRGDIRFESPERLQEQIRKDIERTLEILKRY
jgi:riboflavin kinase/FMN adenylyltransferase